MVKGRTRKLMFGGVFAAIFVAVFMGSFSCKNTSATDFNMSIQSYLSVDFPSFIFIDASPSYTGVQTADATLRVSTNEGGYILIFSADGTKSGPDDTRYTSLVNTSENATIPTLTSSSTRLNFPVGYWGFSIDGGENYRGLTTYDDTNRLVLSSDQPGATDTTDFTFGVKINDVQPAGVYNNTILITTVAKVDDIPEPADINAKALLGDNGHLVFVYDDKQYEVGDAFVNSYTSMSINNIYDVPSYPTDDWYGSLQWLNNSNLVSAVDFDNSFEFFKPISTKAWFYSMPNLQEINGIEYFDTSNVVDMSFMFAASFQSSDNASGLRELKKMDVSNVVDMSFMFSYVGYNSPSNSSWNRSGEILSLSEWDTSNVEDMSYMFEHFGSGRLGHHFIGDLSGWDTSNVRNMSMMFSYLCSNAYQCYSYGIWNNNTGTYEGNVSDNLDLRSWDVSNVEYMTGMFSYVDYDTTYTYGRTIKLSGWDVRNVVDMSNLFSNCGKTINIEANDWHLDSVQYGDNLFYKAGKNELAASLRGWVIGPQANILNGSMFGENSSRRVSIDASGWVVDNNVDKSQFKKVFYGIAGTVENLNISGWSMSGVTDLSYAFAFNTDIQNLNVTGLDTSSVANMEGLFNVSAPKTIIGIENWDTSKVVNMKRAFSGRTFRDYDDTAYSGSVWPTITNKVNYGLEGWDVSSVTDMTAMFDYAELSTRLINSIESWNPVNVVSMADMFMYTKYTNVPGIDLSGWNTPRLVDASSMFEKIYMTGGNTINLSGWNTPLLSNISKMFYNLLLELRGEPKSFSINLSGLDTNKVTDMSWLFGNMHEERAYNNVKYRLDVDLTGWDTSNVVNMEYMFASKCWNSHRIDSDDKRGDSVSELVKALHGLVNFNTSSVRTMAHMFEGFSADPTVWNYDFSNWNTGNVVDMSYMFAGAEAADDNDPTYYGSDFVRKDIEITMDLSGLDTSAVRNMSHMFYQTGMSATSLTINFGFNTSSARDMSYMLYGIGKNAGDFSAVGIGNWNVNNVSDHRYFTDRLELVQPNWP